MEKIVFCEDCEYFEKLELFGWRIMHCKRLCEIPHIKIDDGYYFMVTEKSFCAWAKEKK